MLRGLPRSDNHAYNVCAFCHYWEGNVGLHSHGATQVELDERAMGRCLKLCVNGKKASYPACSRFQISNEASRYAKQ